MHPYRTSTPTVSNSLEPNSTFLGRVWDWWSIWRLPPLIGLNLVLITMNVCLLGIAEKLHFTSGVKALKLMLNCLGASYFFLMGAGLCFLAVTFAIRAFGPKDNLGQ